MTIVKATKIPWIEIKRRYITDPAMTASKLAVEFKQNRKTIEKKATKEGWSALRGEIMKAAEQKMIEEAEYSVREMKERHLKIGKLLQKLGIEAIEKGKYIPKSAKEARQFIAEGVRMEREASGANKNDSRPAVVNIIAQEKGIIEKYLDNVIEGEEVEDGTKQVREESPEGVGK